MVLSKFALNAVLVAAEVFSTPERDPGKLGRIAANIAASVEESPVLPFGGGAAQEATVLALVAISAHESHFRDDIRQCRVRGDHGASVSMYQLHSGVIWRGNTLKDICDNEVLAGKLAIRALVDAQQRLKTIRSMFRGYATGNPAKPAASADATHGLSGMFFTLAKHPDFDIIPSDSNRRVSASWRTNEQEKATTGYGRSLREAGEVSGVEGGGESAGACCMDRPEKVWSIQDGKDGC